MDEDSGYAWDLLPFEKNNFDLYRSPSWHANYNESKGLHASIQPLSAVNLDVIFA